MKLQLIYIDGIIGAGKSSLLKKLQENNNKKNIIFIEEPIHFWKNINNFNALETFYNDPVKHQTGFQIYALITLYLNFIEYILSSELSTPESTSTPSKSTPSESESDSLIIVMERSWHSSVHIFGYELLQNDVYYKAIYDFINYHLKSNFQITSECFVYLNLQPELALRNIQKRNRIEEKNIQISYLQMLQLKHNTWLNTLQNCIIININEKCTIDQVYQEFCKKLQL